MLRLILIIVITLSIGVANGQSNIDFKHKSLLKVLQKLNETENPDMEEIVMADSTRSDYFINGKYFLVSGDNFNTPIKYVYIGRVKSCRAGGCGIIRPNESNEDQEYFDYFILFDSKLNVKLIRVFNYQATYGQEVTSRGWLRQFNGYDGSNELIVGKDIDAISGATISVYGITLDVQEKTEMLRNYFVL